MKNQLLNEHPAYLNEHPTYLPVPDGQERLATQAERDDVNRRIEGLHPSSTKVSNLMARDISMVNLVGLPEGAFEVETVEEQSPIVHRQMTAASTTQREMGDQVNRFLLCTLVSESSKSIKASAEKAGETLPMAMIVRGVLRSYRMALKDKYGPLAEKELDIAGIRMLNKKVLKDEIARHSRDRVSNIKRQLTHARRYGDDAKIKAVEDGLERAIASHDRLDKKVV